MKIGFVGQGWVGKNYADDFERRGYSVIRYSLEQPHVANKDKIQECDIVFIAVPTPTTPRGFDDSIIRHAVRLVGKSKIAVIKSTVVPGTTESIQNENPDIFVFHSPEFLVESTAAYDAAHPTRTIIGMPHVTDTYHAKAEEIIKVLPESGYTRILAARDAELVKYAGNCFLFTKVVYMNLLYDLVVANGGDWASVRDALVHDTRIGESHTEPVHKGGRGAGGHCFIKDFETFRRLYGSAVNDVLGDRVLASLADKNNRLLMGTSKDRDLLTGVYGSIS